MTRAQLLQIGLGAGAIEHRLRAGELRRMHRGVYALGPVAGSRAHELAAVLACGKRSFVSHQSAAWLLGLLPYPARPARVQITVTNRDPGRRTGIRIHRVRTLDAGEVTQMRGIPVTSAGRTILDLATVLPSSELEQLVADAYARRVARRHQLLALTHRRPRHRGARALRTLLEHSGGPAFTRSKAERLLLDLVRQAALSEPRVNSRLRGYEVDFLWPDERLVVEIDGYRYHSSPGRFNADRLRDQELVASGYLVMRVAWSHLVDDPQALIARLAMALARR